MHLYQLATNMNIVLRSRSITGFNLRLFSTTQSVSAGHSKWANIKHDKAKNDAQKNRITNKLANAIAVATKLNGPDPSRNIRLQAAIELANKNNVPKKVVENAIKRGSGAGTDSKTNVETAVYEGIAPGNVSVVVEALTDNKNRTFSDIRGVFGKYGGSLSPTAFQFDRKGFVVLDITDSQLEFDEIFEKISEIEGVEDIEETEVGATIEILTDPSDAGKVTNELKKSDWFQIKEVGISYIPKEDALVEIDDEEKKVKYQKFINALEDVDDVTDFHTTLKE